METFICGHFCEFLFSWHCSRCIACFVHVLHVSDIDPRRYRHLPMLRSHIWPKTSYNLGYDAATAVSCALNGKKTALCENHEYRRVPSASHPNREENSLYFSSTYDTTSGLPKDPIFLLKYAGSIAIPLKRKSWKLPAFGKQSRLMGFCAFTRVFQYHF